MYKISKPPERPYDPNSSMVEFLPAKYGPFLCDNCIFFRGYGKNCQWTNKKLEEGDCCRRFVSPTMKEDFKL